MGQRASDIATIRLEDAEVPPDHLIGDEGEGFTLAMRSLDRTRTMVGAGATGLARAAMEFAITTPTHESRHGLFAAVKPQ